MNESGQNQLPPAARRAIEASRRMGFEKDCLPEVGLLLRALAATVADGTVAEFGTGCGYGAAWLAAGLASGARLVSVESEAELAAAARDVLAGYPNVEIVHGDWTAILDRGPFRLAFVDAGAAKLEGATRVIDALAPGGVALLDDLTPVELWPEAWRGKSDPVRDRWLHDPRLAATELRVTAGHAVILATRLHGD